MLNLVKLLEKHSYSKLVTITYIYIYKFLIVLVLFLKISHNNKLIKCKLLSIFRILLSNKKSLEMSHMPKMELGLRNWAHQLDRELEFLNTPRFTEEIRRRNWNVYLWLL